MSSVNRVILVGRLGDDPEVRYASNGVAVTTLSLATSEKYKTKQGEWREKTQWHRVTVWDKQAEHCGEYLKKGSQVAIEGKIEYESYEKDGEKKYVTKIKSDRVTFLGGGEKSGGRKNTGSPPSTGDSDLEDLPF